MKAEGAAQRQIINDNAI